MPPRALSRHVFTRAIKDVDERTILTDRKPYRFADLFDNRFHVVQEGDSLFTLAGKYFSSFERPAGLWWIIADFQPDPIHDPTLKLESGTTVVVPSERAVREEVFNGARRQETSA